MIIIVIVVVVILIIALPTIAGLLYVWGSGTGGISGDGVVSGGSTVMIAAIKTEKSTAYVVTISSVSNGDLNLEDTRMELTNDEGLRIFSVHTDSADPPSLTYGQTTIYPIPSGSGAVKEYATDYRVTSSTNLEDYYHCYLAYIDENSDGKVTADDKIWIYKDWTRDGTPEVVSRSTFKILEGDGELVLKKQL